MSRPGSRAAADEVVHVEPRLSLLHVLNRVRMRLLDIQVWDVAASMTFYALLAFVPGAVAVVSLMSIIGIEAETLDTLAGLSTEIFPTLDPAPYLRAVRVISTAGGGLLALVLGTLGSLLSASNGVAAFHRALHRVYDTREGRPFLWFRTIVFGETLVIVAVVLLAIGMIILGGEASQRIGELIGVPRSAFRTWNVAKWPILLAILIIGVSLAYHLFPNVRLPRYRVMSLGSVLSVLVLFVAALLLGRLMEYATRFAEVLTVLNGLIAILLVLWIACIVIITGAALDAEFLRARQIASGLDAGDRILLAPQATHTQDFLEADAADAERVGHLVARSVRSGRTLRIERTRWIVPRTSIWAIDTPAHGPITTDPDAVAALEDDPAPGDREARADGEGRA